VHLSQLRSKMRTDCENRSTLRSTAREYSTRPAITPRPGSYFFSPRSFVFYTATDMPTAAVTTFHGNVETVRSSTASVACVTQTRVSKYEAIRRPQLHRARPNERGIDRGSQSRKKMYFRYSNPRVERSRLFRSRCRRSGRTDTRRVKRLSSRAYLEF